MISMYNASGSRDKKLLAEAQQMLSDAKTKIEIIRMQMLRTPQQSNGPEVEGERSTVLTPGSAVIPEVIVFQG